MKKYFLVVLSCALFLVSCEGGRSSQIKKEKATTCTPVKQLHNASISVDGKSTDWDHLGIVPISGLNWLGSFSKPADSERLRIKSMRFTHDGENFFILMSINPGIEEDFVQRGRTGSLSYIFIDADGTATTGQRRNATDTYAGYDYRIYVETGFAGNTATMMTKPLVGYKIEKMKKTTIEQTQYGSSFNIDLQEIEGGRRNSIEDNYYIASQGRTLEIRIPSNLMKIEAPAKIHLVVQDLSAFPKAETEVNIDLQKN